MSINNRISQGWDLYNQAPPAPGSTSAPIPTPVPAAKPVSDGGFWGDVGGFFQGATDTLGGLFNTWRDVFNPPSNNPPPAPPVTAYQPLPQKDNTALYVALGIAAVGAVVAFK
ncbi:hypothetical protein [Pseudovibrio ascidiaceicola]|uniref:hypothetical protein n=1 Tax=Pseudovibrio ascidiaceicola TaxID=285279 RepID=UPI000D6988A3|nr:hypothetical protein [Pseudovibrio ascidiaceicola]